MITPDLHLHYGSAENDLNFLAVVIKSLRPRKHFIPRRAWTFHLNWTKLNMSQKVYCMLVAGLKAISQHSKQLNFCVPSTAIWWKPEPQPSWSFIDAITSFHLQNYSHSRINFHKCCQVVRNVSSNGDLKIWFIIIASSSSSQISRSWREELDFWRFQVLLAQSFIDFFSLSGSSPHG